MKLNLNTQNVLLGILLLYFIYDIYKKYIQNNSEYNSKHNLTLIK